ncbi:DsbA family protein [Pseudogemmobacter humi]|uniref:Protein disulfide isomerase II DsbC n=1 Tax=Pseudogemmobacter humi TaxID=2483812 RepID=A0A3P5XE42_9RHOB|nr:DsbA family protein [Pseudogemmobacter humi]VDC33053.1 protein disulfide isomerase II DsbC [Pseudogemmobacter humi]
MRLALTLAAALSAPFPALAEGLTDMTEAERAAFGEAVRDYLLENPEVIIDAMKVLQTREDKAAAEQDLLMLAENRETIFNNPNDWAGGNLAGDITVVEFMDYRCGYCHKAFQEVEELVASDGNIRFVLKEFPVLGEQSVLAAKFAISVRMLHGDAAYKAAHDALFAMRGDMTIESLSRLAGQLGHDPAGILVQMEAPEVQAMIDETYALAETMQINGTPTFVIDEAMVRGYVPLDGMRQIVLRQREG